MLPTPRLLQLLGTGSFAKVFAAKARPARKPNTSWRPLFPGADDQPLKLRKGVELASAAPLATGLGVRQLPATVAVKLYSRASLKDPAMRELVMAEASAMRDAGDHANICRLLDAFEDYRGLCIVMDHCAGGTLVGSLRRFRAAAEAASTRTGSSGRRGAAAGAAVARPRATKAGKPRTFMGPLQPHRPRVVPPRGGPAPPSAAEQRGGIPPDRARVLFLGLARAVRHLHRRGIAHRDVKMDNVVIDSGRGGDLALRAVEGGRVRLCDFGFATRVQSSRSADKEARVEWGAHARALRPAGTALTPPMPRERWGAPPPSPPALSLRLDDAGQDPVADACADGVAAWGFEPPAAQPKWVGGVVSSGQAAQGAPPHGSRAPVAVPTPRRDPSAAVDAMWASPSSGSSRPLSAQSPGVAPSPPPTPPPSPPQLVAEGRGSLVYMAPEALVRGRQHLARPADVWSLGVCFYVLLTGRFPFQGDSEADVVRQVRTARPTAEADGIAPDHPASSLLLGMLRRNPRERLTAEAVCADPWLRGGRREPDLTDTSPRAAMGANDGVSPAVGAGAGPLSVLLAADAKAEGGWVGPQAADAGTEAPAREEEEEGGVEEEAAHPARGGGAVPAGAAAWFGGGRAGGSGAGGGAATPGAASSGAFAAPGGRGAVTVVFRVPARTTRTWSDASGLGSGSEDEPEDESAPPPRRSRPVPTPPPVLPRTTSAGSWGSHGGAGLPGAPSSDTSSRRASPPPLPQSDGRVLFSSAIHASHARGGRHRSPPQGGGAFRRPEPGKAGAREPRGRAMPAALASLL